MAVDTAEKRRSVGGLPFLIPGVTPNSAQDQEWRQESGWGYSGILVGVPSAVSITSDILDYNAFIFRINGYDVHIERTADANAFIRRIEDYEVER